jgi:hypothetical protein
VIIIVFIFMGNYNITEPYYSALINQCTATSKMGADRVGLSSFKAYIVRYREKSKRTMLK